MMIIAIMNSLFLERNPFIFKRFTSYVIKKLQYAVIASRLVLIVSIGTTEK
jgi:hypothetical protein